MSSGAGRVGSFLPTLLVSALVVAATLASLAIFRRALPDATAATSTLAGAALAVALVFGIHRLAAARFVWDGMQAVSDGLLSLSEGDYGVRLAVVRDDEVGQLIRRFNALAETLRRDRSGIYQKEMLLETVLAASTTIAVIINEGDRIVYANQSAQQFIGGGKKLEGRILTDLLASGPAELRAAAAATHDLLFTCTRQGPQGAEPETFHLSKHYFEISTQRHTLLLLKPLTKELARKEVETWKKAIRVLSHEVNNSLAPITSLLHSARLMAANPAAHQGRLAAAMDTIEERANHLKTFLDGYASFARLPLPSKRPVPWKELLAGVEGLYPFVLEGNSPEGVSAEGVSPGGVSPGSVSPEGVSHAGPSPGHLSPESAVFADPSQLQQVLINLLKNAAESGSAAKDITMSFTSAPRGGVELVVQDRGKGMSAEVLRNALLPFYSTKKAGSGLGLALCHEILEAHGGRLSLHPREGGGLTVRCWLPSAPAQVPSAT